MKKIISENILNEEYVVDISDIGMNFEGIAKIDNKIIFIPGAITGEKVKIKIIKDNKNYSIGKIINILSSSSNREIPICDNYNLCGGCKGLHLNYTESLNMKKNIAINTLRKQGIDVSKVESIYGMGNPYEYRNKVIYPVSNYNDKNIIGMYKENSHDIIEISNCYIQHPLIDDVAKFMLNLLGKEDLKGYNEKTKEGEIKNIMVRRGFHTDEILCVYVVNKDDRNFIKKIENISKELIEKYKNIKSVTININKNEGNTILSDNTKVIYGKGYITDKIGEKTYQISTNSFFQVNTNGAEIIYELLKEKLKLQKNNILLELYSGVGSIGIYLAQFVNKVYGIEIVKEAVDMAKTNCKINNIKNAEYFVGDANIKTKELLEKEKHIDIVVVDPPRKGLEKEGIDILKEIKPKKIGYISCNAATLARDLKELSDIYEIDSINFVDMFPCTSHIESVVVLNKI